MENVKTYDSIYDCSPTKKTRTKTTSAFVKNSIKAVVALALFAAPIFLFLFSNLQAL